MPDFDDTRKALSSWRAEREQTHNALLLAREAVKRGKPGAEGLLRELEQVATSLDARGAGLWESFAAFTSPKEALRRLHDRHPILLFPLRLETRFKTVGDQAQLWVRVYPDQCLAESFEPELTEAEARNAQVFWSGIWRAGGIDAEERAAWRDLAMAHGVGRASWIVKRHTPLNPADQPQRNKPSDVLLVIVATTDAPAATAAFWEKVWRAGGTEAAVVAARPALEEEVGVATAARIIEECTPVNLGQPPGAGETRATNGVKLAVIKFPPLPSLELRRTSWSRAPRVRLLPERLVLMAWRGQAPSGDDDEEEALKKPEIEQEGATIQAPLAVGPDPGASGDEQLRPDGDDLKIPDSIRWMFDFERALEVGMAFRIDLTQQQADSGFTRIVVLGVRVSDTPAEGKSQLESLLDDHLRSRAGFELLPQGTPTNNTESESTRFNVHGDPDASFNTGFREQPAFTAEADPLLRRDGEWFAQLLGISPALAQRIPNAGGRDQLEARAMNLALWPGTIGYMMRTMLAPVFAEADVEATRSFFARCVSGRGAIPAVRVGAQPYGILPVTSFGSVNWFDADISSRLAIFRDQSFLSYLRRLRALLMQIEQEWDAQLAKVSFVGKTGAGVDPHQVLLDVLDLQASSVEFHSLKADSETHKYHLLSFLSQPLALALLRNLPTKQDALALLSRLGYSGATEPDAVKKLFSGRTPPLQGAVIDTVEFSETDPIAPCAGAMNYLEWLVNGARTNFDIIQEQRGFDAGREPSALLYLLLRHALQIAYSGTAQREKARRGLIEAAQVSYAEPAFVHVQSEKTVSESRYNVLYETVNGRRLSEVIRLDIDAIDPELSEQVAAIERLTRTPTAPLERAFAEHIDCASYRLDAWKQGLLAWQLERIRSAGEGQDGTYLGAYGWLEDVRPEGKTFTPVKLPADVDALVNKPGDASLMRESTNLGLIHAPSLNHATTAAVLRNGYQANGGRMAVDLSSQRVRLALGIIEGMRVGQSLGALLGYRFERHLHDAGILQLRATMYAIRRQFPLAVQQIKSTKDDTLAIEAIAASNVVDGRALLRHVEASPQKSYPWGIATLPLDPDATRRAAMVVAIDAAVTHVRDVNDAVADLALAEGVHQAVIGNYDRSAGTLEAFAKGGLPPEVDVIHTPRSGTSLTLRTAVHLDPAVTANPIVGLAMSPMAKAEPVLNAWLGARLPAADNVGCRVTWVDRTTGAQAPPAFVTQRDLKLQPLDLIYLMQETGDVPLGFLDDRVLQFVHTTATPALGKRITVEYTTRVLGKVTFFELRALITSLYAMTIASRPLKPADLIRQADARGAEQPQSQIAVGRLTAAQAELAGARTTALQTLLANLPAGTVDGAITAYANEVSKLAAWRLPQTGVGFVFQWRQRQYEALAKKLDALIARWTAIRDDARQKLIDFDGAPGLLEPEQRSALATIELLVSTSYITPQPTTVAAFRTAVGNKLTAFDNELTTVKGFAATNFSTLAAFAAALQGEPLDTFERDALKLSEDLDEIVRFRLELKRVLEGLIAEVGKRATSANTLLTKTPLTIDATQAAAKKLFGDDFQVIPTFTLRATAAADVTAAHTHFQNGGLTQYVVNTIGREFPVDDWLHGVARVREKIRHWENAIALCDAFGTASPEPVPLQLPFEAGDNWLALEIPPAATDAERAITRDKLLYTAHFPAGFDATQQMAGLLVDEWNEVIPEKTETTGVAFHYDRPNSEPPQCWLLALPAVMDGAWSWEELRDAVTGTLDAARRRAIEPDHLATTAYSWFLPATYSAYTFPEISISNYLLRNVAVLAQLKDA
jgi:hypothetical protein